MKTCPICQREYPISARYCTRDGTPLQVAAEVNQCQLCNRYYPINVTTCPVHGTTLNTVASRAMQPTLAAKTTNSAPINFVNANSITAPAIDIVNNPGNSWPLMIKPASNQANLVAVDADLANSGQLDVGLATQPNSTYAEPLITPYPSAITRELQPNSLIANNSDAERLDTLGIKINTRHSPLDNSNQLVTKPAESYSRRLLPLVGQVMGQAARERRLVMGLTATMTILLTSFIVYSLPGVFQQIRGKAAPLPWSNRPVVDAMPQEVSSEKLAVNEQEVPDFIQKIKWIPDATPSLVPSASAGVNEKLSSLDMAAKPSLPNGLKSTPPPDGGDPSKEARAVTTAKKAPTSSQIAVASEKLQAAPLLTKEAPSSAGIANTGTVTPSNTTTLAKSETTIKQTTNPSITKTPIIANNAGNTANGGDKPRLPNLAVAKASARPDPISNSKPTESVTLEKEESVPTQVVARVVNKSRRPVEDGYVYQFRLVLREVNGKVVDWRQATAQKTNYAGQCRPVNLEIERTAVGNTVYYRATVRMTGVSIEDWFGELHYKLVGVDDEGTPVQLQNSLLLDTSFPLH